MKRIINGRKYDTGTAELLGRWNNGCYTTDLDYEAEDLYRKRNGEFFMYCDSGPRGTYAVPDCGGMAGGDAIVPLEVAQARAWAERHLSADKYEDIFGEVEE